MKLFRHTAAALVLAAAAALTANAQPGANRGAATTPAAPAQTGAALGTPKIAIIDTSAFTDEKEGITKFVNAIRNLQTQFKPQIDELERIERDYQTLAADIEKTAPVAAPEATRAKVDRAEQMKKDGQRKAEDLDAAQKRKQTEVLGPLRAEIVKAMQEYARGRGITMLLDAGNLPIVYMEPGMNITREFIADYNRRAGTTTASAPTPR